MFLAEPDKAVVALIKPRGKAAGLVKVAVGEQVDLVVNGRALWVRDARGTVVGAVLICQDNPSQMAGARPHRARLAAPGATHPIQRSLALPRMNAT